MHKSFKTMAFISYLKFAVLLIVMLSCRIKNDTKQFYNAGDGIFT